MYPDDQSLSSRYSLFLQSPGTEKTLGSCRYTSTAYLGSWVQVPEKHKRVQLGKEQELTEVSGNLSNCFNRYLAQVPDESSGAACCLLCVAH